MMISGGLAATAAGAHTLWSYNRKNFLFDREMRQKQEYQVLEWRCKQSELWRDDIRDIIGLTEKKMDTYLVVAVLLVDTCLAFFTEGRLEPGTPPWLLHFYMLTLGGTFMYLLMSVWCAMHASIVASCSSVRILTQFARLPVPTWEQVESMRTYASSYEGLEARRVLRVPFVGHHSRQKATGSIGEEDEDCEKGSASSSGAPQTPASPFSPSSASRLGGQSSRSFFSNAAGSAGQPHPAAVDPWGRELHGAHRDDVEELAPKPLELRRHVELARRAAQQYQSFDAFARVCMAFGLNQFSSAVTYYCLGYAAVQDGAPAAAWCVAVIMTSVAVAMLQMDYSLTRREKIVGQALIVTGPACASVATYLWALHGSGKISDVVLVLLPITYASHCLWLYFSLQCCGLKMLENGAILPSRFRAVLYLDVFGWVSGKPYGGGPPPTSRPPLTPDQCGAAAAAAAPSGQVDDHPEDIFHPESYGIHGTSLSKGANAGADESVVTGHHKAHPGQLPATIFRLATWMLIVLWGLGCALPLEVCRGFMMTPYLQKGFMQGGEEADKEQDEADFELDSDFTGVAGAIAEANYRSLPTLPEGTLIEVEWPSHSGFVPRSLSCDPSGQRFVVADDLGVFAGQLVKTASTVAVASINTGGATGRDATPAIATTAGIGASAGPTRRRLRAEPATSEGESAPDPDEAENETALFGRLIFQRVPPCSVMDGQAVQDMAVACTEADFPPKCRVVVLLGQGKRLAECPLPPTLAPGGEAGNIAMAGAAGGGRSSNSSSGAEMVSWPISHEWLRDEDDDGDEVVASVAVNSNCLEGDLVKVGTNAFHPDTLGCVVVGTSEGRVVQLRGSLAGDARLVPDFAMEKGPRSVSRGSLHIFPDGRVMALQRHTGVVQAFDSEGGRSVGEWRLPRDVHWLALCGGRDSLFALGLRNGTGVELRRFPLPPKLAQPRS